MRKDAAGSSPEQATARSSRIEPCAAIDEALLTGPDARIEELA
jgi:hypothetical protein